MLSKRGKKKKKKWRELNKTIKSEGEKEPKKENREIKRVRQLLYKNMVPNI